MVAINYDQHDYRDQHDYFFLLFFQIVIQFFVSHAPPEFLHEAN